MLRVARVVAYDARLVKDLFGRDGVTMNRVLATDGASFLATRTTCKSVVKPSSICISFRKLF